MKELAPGTLLDGRYAIVRTLGAGGMGIVYEARDLRLPRRLAIKVLPRQTVVDDGVAERFQREAEIAASLNHPHIVQVFELRPGDDETDPYIVMELLEGRDLAAELAAAGRMPPARVARIVEQIASALSAMHGRGIVHRDLKPQNLFVLSLRDDEREFVKVLDFGVSKVTGGGSLTDGARLMGTPQYMAPEQARGHSEEIDGRSDQFALAAIAWELLAGRPPFRAEGVASTLFLIAHEEPPALSSVVPGLPAAIDEVVRRGMAKRKSQRFATVHELAEALAVAADVRPGKRASFATLTSVGAPPAARRRWPAVVLFGSMAALSGALIVRDRMRRATARTQPAPTPTPTPELPRVLTTPAPPAPVEVPVESARPRRRAAQLPVAPAAPEPPRRPFVEELPPPVRARPFIEDLPAPAPSGAVGPERKRPAGRSRGFIQDL